MLPPDKFTKLMVLFPVGGYYEPKLPSDGHLNNMSTDTFAMLECSKHTKSIYYSNLGGIKFLLLVPLTISLASQLCCMAE